MAAGASIKAATINGTHSTTKPIECAITLPHSPGTKILLHLTLLASSITLFLTSGSIDSGGAGSAMGSFVYAMPDRYNPTQPLSTPIYTVPSSLDFTTRMAKLLARKTGKLCYVGNSINLAGAAGGGSVEEEMEAFRAIVEVVMSEVGRSGGIEGGN